MKTRWTLLFLFGFAIGGLAQSDADRMDYNGKKNELSLEVTPLIQRLSPTTDLAFNVPGPAYFIRYRRLFDGFNLRAQLGGGYSKSPLSNRSADNVMPELFRKNQSIQVALGAELVSDIRKRAQVNYGVDFFYSASEFDNDANFSQSGYYFGSESRGTSFGAAAVLGLRFWFWERISLGTEGSFQFSRSTVESRDTQIRYLDSVPELTPEPFNEQTTIQTNFNIPIVLWIGLTI